MKYIFLTGLLALSLHGMEDIDILLAVNRDSEQESVESKRAKQREEDRKRFAALTGLVGSSIEKRVMTPEEKALRDEKEAAEQLLRLQLASGE